MPLPKKMLAQIIAESSNVMATASIDGTVLFVNQAGQGKLGITPGEFGAIKLDALLAPWAARLVMEEGIPSALRDGGWEAESALRLRDGTELPVMQKIFAHRGEDGTTEFLSTICTDITKRKVAEEALRRANERFRAVARATRDTIWEWEPAAGVTWCEHFAPTGFQPPTGRPADTLRWLESVHPEDRERMQRMLAGLIEGDQTSFAAEYRLIAPDGSCRWAHDRGVIERDGTGRAVRFVGATADITERKQFESRMMQADRLAALGSLAAGIVHELNNPLCSLLGNLDYFAAQLDELKGAPPERLAGGLAALAEAVEDARHGVDRLRSLAGDLRTFARPGDAELVLAPTDVRTVLESALNLAGPQIKHRARVVRELDEVPLVQADPARLGQVLLNLLINAAHAIEQAGPGENEIRVRTRLDRAERVAIEICDTGCGIAPEVGERLFDPFFTTKSAGEGSGLGLPISRSLVLQMGGEIEFESEVGRGTTFRVLLPIAK